MSSGGWTLIEIMLALAVLGVLLALAVPSYSDRMEKVKIAKAVQDITIIAFALDSYFEEEQRFPDSLDAVGMGGMLDPWEKPYQYVSIQSVNGNGKLRKDRNLVPINTDYDLYSMGPDGKSQTPLTAKASQDDIIRASDGGFIGPASDY